MDKEKLNGVETWEETLLSLYFCTEYKGRTPGSYKSKVKIYKAISFLMFYITAWEATQMTGTAKEINCSLVTNFSICS